jgi:phosphoglycerate dehydrogenase-like enzyme
LLGLFNKINTADAQVKAGHWNREANRGHELDGKPWGLSAMAIWARRSPKNCAALT